jgi:aminopeptidase-like protein
VRAGVSLTAKPSAPGESAPAAGVGQELHAFASQLYPICRSITGNGVRQTLDLIGRRIELERHEVPSASKVFDWEVPLEWNIEDAYVLGPDGERTVNFRDHNLHIVSYSEPMDRTVTLEELRPRLHTLPGRPDWVPYRTSYYRRDWGFCMSDRKLQALRPGRYQVRVDSSLAPGSLSYAECVLPGQSKQEVLFFTHVCHPSLANDNTSGMAIATFLASWIGARPRRYSYRFVFAPGTIGSLCWLSRNEQRLKFVRHGLVLGLLGDPGVLTYKRSRRGDCEIDELLSYLVSQVDPPGKVIDFEPYGYDERQLCSPGFNLPVGRLTRSVNDGYPQYHSSADDLELISAGQLQRSLEVCQRMVETLESNRRYINLSPKGEPRLGKRGLYGAIGGRSPADRERAMLWILNQSDGSASLLDIARRSSLSYAAIQQAAEELAGAGLLAAETTVRKRRKRPGLRARRVGAKKAVSGEKR